MKKGFIALFMLLFLPFINADSLTLTTDTSARIGENIGITANLTDGSSVAIINRACIFTTTTDTNGIVELVKYNENEALFPEFAGLKTNEGGMAYYTHKIDDQYYANTNYTLQLDCGTAIQTSEITVLAAGNSQIQNLTSTWLDNSWIWVGFIIAMILLIMIAGHLYRSI